MINYMVYPGRDKNEYLSSSVKLTAKTDRGARIQAKRIAKQHMWHTYFISFYRSSDGCNGTISI